jgi:hypothetical protein
VIFNQHSSTCDLQQENFSGDFPAGNLLESISTFPNGPIEHELGNLKKNVAAPRGIDGSPDNAGNTVGRLKNLCRRNQIGVEATGRIEYPKSVGSVARSGDRRRHEWNGHSCSCRTITFRDYFYGIVSR